MGLALPSVKQVNILLMVGRTAISIMDSLYNRLFIWITLGASKHATLTVPQIGLSEKAKAAQIHDYNCCIALYAILLQGSNIPDKTTTNQLT